MAKIIVTGPESSGKTTLCENIAHYFNLSYNKEYARKYLEKLNRKYIKDDLINIATGQLESEKNIHLLDTDLITIKIWSDYKYGMCDDWILKNIKKQKTENRFYLLCKPDIAWEEDKLRENPNNRLELFEIYKKEINELQHDYCIISGEDRFNNHFKKIKSLITHLKI